MLEDLEVVENTQDMFKANPTIIRIIGCGGGGSNSVKRMIQSGVTGVQFFVLNTDLQALYNSPSPNKISIGQTITGGLGAGGNPEVGKLAAEEDAEKIKEIVTGANMVILTAGMGGGTGTGSVPIVAKIAKEAGCLTVAVVTTPFAFEREVRMENAKEGIKQLRDNVDSLIIIPNEQVYHLDDRKPRNMKEAYLVADEVVCQGVTGITELITKETVPNLDFADVTTIMKNQGDAILGVGYGEGENRATDAALAAISNPLLADSKIDGATKILINIESGCDDFSITPDELRDISRTITTTASKHLELIYGSLENPEITTDKLRVTVIATGFSNSFDEEDDEDVSSGKDDDSDVIGYTEFSHVFGGTSSGSPAYSGFKAPEEKAEEKEDVPVSVKEIFGHGKAEPEDSDQAEEDISEEKPVKKVSRFPEGYKVNRNDINTPTFLRNLSREINLTDDDE
ncbi:cell division protein FtsZ [Treponema sp.]|uniref:cell division protein FtsZ n=1 Tax=Treponema sp. TaxID=166 RepID=UPI0025ECB9AC|nr:cell division protein FtsZ [Treponema sp.]MCR5217190.1 cell division protein FtsZ [Treponema sp.]